MMIVVKMIMMIVKVTLPRLVLKVTGKVSGVGDSGEVNGYTDGW